jgi:hypothetical protein
MQYILTGVIVLIFSGLVIHGLTLLLERVSRAFRHIRRSRGCGP